MTDDISRPRRRAASRTTPCVPLTDAQYEAYTSLVAQADALHDLGHAEDAQRIDRLACDILRAGAPTRG